MDRYAVFSSFFFRCYAAIWRVASPFLKRNKRLKQAFAERLAPDGWSDRQDVWIQAASGGEAHLALSLLKALPKETKLRVLLCTWTKQGWDVLDKGREELKSLRPALEITVRYAPLDAPSLVNRAMSQARPRALVLLETELWPGLLGACAEHGVPVHVINGRMSKTSFELYRIILPVLRNLPLCSVHAISEDDAARFRDIFGQDTAVSCSINVMPNIKFDRADEALALPPSEELLPLFRQCGGMILLASVREQEEKKLAPLIGKMLKSRPDACIVIAPRHMHRVQAWYDRLYDLGLQPVLATSLAEGEELAPGAVLVWDSFGSLPKLYAAANSVFVGGSLGLGGQNFLEALAGGVVPCVGSSLENFRWALGEDHPPTLVEAGLLTICQNHKDIQTKLLEGLEQKSEREEVRKRFLAWLTPHTGGSKLAAKLVLQAVDFAE